MVSPQKVDPEGQDKTSSPRVDPDPTVSTNKHLTRLVRFSILQARRSSSQQQQQQQQTPKDAQPGKDSTSPSNMQPPSRFPLGFSEDKERPSTEVKYEYNEPPGHHPHRQDSGGDGDDDEGDGRMGVVAVPADPPIMEDLSASLTLSNGDQSGYSGESIRSSEVEDHDDGNLDLLLAPDSGSLGGQRMPSNSSNDVYNSADMYSSSGEYGAGSHCSGMSSDSSDSIMRRVEEEIANARKASNDAHARLAYFTQRQQKALAPATSASYSFDFDNLETSGDYHAQLNVLSGDEYTPGPPPLQGQQQRQTNQQQSQPQRLGKGGFSNNYRDPSRAASDDNFSNAVGAIGREFDPYAATDIEERVDIEVVLAPPQGNGATPKGPNSDQRTRQARGSPLHKNMYGSPNHRSGTAPPSSYASPGYPTDDSIDIDEALIASVFSERSIESLPVKESIPDVFSEPSLDSLPLQDTPSTLGIDKYGSMSFHDASHADRFQQLSPRTGQSPRIVDNAFSPGSVQAKQMTNAYANTSKQSFIANGTPKERPPLPAVTSPSEASAENAAISPRETMSPPTAAATYSPSRRSKLPSTPRDPNTPSYRERLENKLKILGSRYPISPPTKALSPTSKRPESPSLEKNAQASSPSKASHQALPEAPSTPKLTIAMKNLSVISPGVISPLGEAYDGLESRIKDLLARTLNPMPMETPRASGIKNNDAHYNASPSAELKAIKKLLEQGVAAAAAAEEKEKGKQAVSVTAQMAALNLYQQEASDDMLSLPVLTDTIPESTMKSKDKNTTSGELTKLSSDVSTGEPKTQDTSAVALSPTSKAPVPIAREPEKVSQEAQPENITEPSPDRAPEQEPAEPEAVELERQLGSSEPAQTEQSTKSHEPENLQDPIYGEGAEQVQDVIKNLEEEQVPSPAQNPESGHKQLKLKQQEPVRELETIQKHRQEDSPSFPSIPYSTSQEILEQLDSFSQSNEFMSSKPRKSPRKKPSSKAKQHQASESAIKDRATPVHEPSHEGEPGISQVDSAPDDEIQQDNTMFFPADETENESPWSAVPMVEIESKKAGAGANTFALSSDAGRPKGEDSPEPIDPEQIDNLDELTEETMGVEQAFENDKAGAVTKDENREAKVTEAQAKITQDTVEEEEVPDKEGQTEQKDDKEKEVVADKDDQTMQKGGSSSSAQTSPKKTTSALTMALFRPASRDMKDHMNEEKVDAEGAAPVEKAIRKSEAQQETANTVEPSRQQAAAMCDDQEVKDQGAPEIKDQGTPTTPIPSHNSGPVVEGQKDLPPPTKAISSYDNERAVEGLQDLSPPSTTHFDDASSVETGPEMWDGGELSPDIPDENFQDADSFSRESQNSADNMKTVSVMTKVENDGPQGFPEGQSMLESLRETEDSKSTKNDKSMISPSSSSPKNDNSVLPPSSSMKEKSQAEQNPAAPARVKSVSVQEPPEASIKHTEMAAPDARQSEMVMPRVSSRQERKIRFRDPYPTPKPCRKPRSNKEIQHDHSCKPSSLSDRDIKWKDPKGDLKRLLIAALDTSLARRSNACGALKVISKVEKNKVVLVRTKGFLDALVFVATDDINSAEPDAKEDARARAISCIYNVSRVKENRLPICMHPGLLECLVKTINEDRGEARMEAAGILAQLAKNAMCRECMVQVDDLLSTLASILKGTIDPEEKLQVISQDATEDVPSSSYSEMSSVLSEEHIPFPKHTNSAQKLQRTRKVRADCSIRMQKSDMYDQYYDLARLSSCAALIHMSKQCSILVSGRNKFPFSYDLSEHHFLIESSYTLLTNHSSGPFLLEYVFT